MHDVSENIAIGAGIGGLVLGVLVGLAGTYALTACLRRHRRRRVEHHGSDDDDEHPLEVLGKIEPWIPPGSSHSTLVTAGPSTSTPHYPTHPSAHEPYPHHPPELVPNRPPYPQPEQHQPPLPLGPPSPGPSTQPDPPQQPPHHVYVVHHDGGPPPVSVYTADGTRVVELPPTYVSGRPLEQRRNPGPTPRKRPDVSPSGTGLRIRNRDDAGDPYDDDNDDGR